MTATLLRGQQTPRLQLAPPCVANAAQDAIDIYEAAGAYLDPWQELCLRVGCGEAADGTWAAFEVGIICQRQNGKGAPIEALLLASAFVWGNQETIYAAHRGDTARAIFRRVRRLIENCPDLARRVEPISDSDEVITLLSGARIEFRTRARGGGRGLTGDFLVLDEALELDPDLIAALVPVLLARPYAQLWYFSTVPTSADQHLCTVRARVLDGGSERLAWAEWGVDAGAALDDPQALAQANPALGYRITLERLKDLRGILGDAKYSTECMGIWPDTSPGVVLSPAVWRTMLDVESRRGDGADVVLALDCDLMREHGNISMHALRADGLEHVQLTDYEAGVDWMIDRAAELKAALNPVLWVILKANGVYALLDKLAGIGIKPAEDPQKLKRGDLLVLEASENSDAVGQFIDAFRAKPPPMRHPGQLPLNRAIENAKARSVGDGGRIAWARRASKGDIGPVVSVTMARYGSHAWLTRQKVIPRSKVW